MAAQTRGCGRKYRPMPGVPGCPLPIWANIPLEWKLPMPDILPSGAVNLFYGPVGNSPWRADKRLDFDTSDPYNRKLPAKQEYNPLIDPHLRTFLRRPDLAKNLFRRGLITRDGQALCTLEDYNRYRCYLHRFNVRVVKTMEKRNEPGYVKDMVFSTVGHMSNHKRALERNRADPSLRKVRYSAVLSNEAARVSNVSAREFHKSKIMQKIPTGEENNLEKLKDMLQEDCRKTALLRLRRLQDYDDRHHKGLNDWKKKRVAQMEFLAENKARNKCLEEERVRYVQEHMQYIACQQENSLASIQQGIQQRAEERKCRDEKILQQLCPKLQREWPMTARCPHREAEGDDPCRDCSRLVATYQVEVNELFDYSDFACATTVRPIWEQTKKPYRFCLKKSSKKHRIKVDEETVSKLTQYIVINVINLVVKHSNTPQEQLRIQSAQDSKQRPNKMQRSRLESAVSNRRAKWFLDMITLVIIEEIGQLVRQPASILLFMADTLDRSVRTFNDDDEEEAEPMVDWDHAPEMVSDSESMTGNYVRDTVVDVLKDLEREGAIPSERVQLIHSVMTNAVTEVTFNSIPEEIGPNLKYGDEMLRLALTLLSHHRGDDCHRQRLSAVVVTGIMRLVLERLKRAMVCQKIRDEDLADLAALAEGDEYWTEMRPHGQANSLNYDAIHKAVEHCSQKLMNSNSITKLIADTVRNVAQKHNAEEEYIKSHVADSAKQFISKVIDNVFADLAEQENLTNNSNSRVENNANSASSGEDATSVTSLSDYKNDNENGCDVTLSGESSSDVTSMNDVACDEMPSKSVNIDIKALNIVPQKLSTDSGDTKGHIVDSAKQFTSKLITNVFEELSEQESLYNDDEDLENNEDKTENKGDDKSKSKLAPTISDDDFWEDENRTNNNNGAKNKNVIDGDKTQNVNTSPDRKNNNGSLNKVQSTEAKILPVFGDMSMSIDRQLVENALGIISVKRDEDLYDGASLGKRNSFRNVQRPDVSKTSRYQAATTAEATNLMQKYAMELLNRQNGLDKGDGDDDKEDDDSEATSAEKISSSILSMSSDNHADDSDTGSDAVAQEGACAKLPLTPGPRASNATALQVKSKWTLKKQGAASSRQSSLVEPSLKSSQPIPIARTSVMDGRSAQFSPTHGVPVAHDPTEDLARFDSTESSSTEQEEEHSSVRRSRTRELRRSANMRAEGKDITFEESSKSHPKFCKSQLSADDHVISTDSDSKTDVDSARF